MDKLVERLRAILGRGRVLSDAGELLVYECDGLPQHKHAPRAVVFPESTEEVSEVMTELASAGAHFAPRGAGTGLSGGAVALNRAVVIELARMRRVLSVDAENRTARVQPGVVNAQLSRAVAPHGLHYAPDPSSQASCTIGGNIAENAGGIHCLKYGTTVDHVLAARVVLSDGAVVDLGGDTGETAGLDLLGVFVGSEGTFGVTTEATVRLTPLPQAVRTLLADFTDINDASRAVSAIIAAGIIPAALEMVDGATIAAVEASVFAAGLPLDAQAALLVELDGLAAGLDIETARVEALCRATGARNCRRAGDEAERKKLWAARKGAFGAMGRLAPDVMIQDAVVPRSRLPEVLAETYRIGAKYSLRLANVFHAGDGNLHPFISFDSRDAEEARRVKEAGREMMQTCVRAGGTITGEHGVGFDKSEYLPLIFSEDTLSAMLEVRAAFDPLGLCNPGKIIPTPRGCGEARAVAKTFEQPRGASEEGEETQWRRVVSEQKDGASVAESSLSGAPASPFAPFRMKPPPARETPRTSARPFDTESASAKLTTLLGADKVDRVQGGRVRVEPESAEEACEVLRAAACEGWAVVPAGAGVWLDAGNSLGRAGVFISTRRLTRLVEHEPADLVATAGAGLTLCAFNGELRRSRQWLPVDPPDDGRATIGGVVATGLAGAQSFGYGRPRAHVLGMRVALAGGRDVRFGGRVVKNVAGYDLGKLFAGSYGTLGLMLELTFKLRPLPAAEATVVARSGDHHKLFEAARAVINSRLLPVAVELLSPRVAREVGAGEREDVCVLLIRFAGAPETVAYQTRSAVDIFDEGAWLSSVETINEDAGHWAGVAACALKQPARLVWRASVRASEIPALLDKARKESGAKQDGDFAWQAGAGDGRLRVFDDTRKSAEETSALLGRLRDFARRAGGSLVVERAAPELKGSFDLWGIADDSALLMRRVKEQLDPGDLFSPGRFFT